MPTSSVSSLAAINYENEVTFRSYIDPPSELELCSEVESDDEMTSYTEYRSEENHSDLIAKSSSSSSFPSVASVCVPFYPF